jgi:hypothetical protein
MRNPFARENLGHQLREAYSMGWFNLIFVPFIVLPGLAAGSLLWRGIDVGLAQSSGGVAGIVSIIDCQPTGRRQSSWRCAGEFTSDDGTVHIARLQLFPVFDERPSARVKARVSGPDATIATSPTGLSWLIPIGGGVAFAGLTVYLLYRCYLEPSSAEPKRRAPNPRRRRRRWPASHALETPEATRAARTER